jgi:pimeloyl-ACP methyl ester carboxylesterase
MAEKQAQKESLIHLSRNAVLVRADSTGHHVHLEQPAFVISVVRGLVNFARRRQAPPPD